MIIFFEETYKFSLIDHHHLEFKIIKSLYVIMSVCLSQCVAQQELIWQKPEFSKRKKSFGKKWRIFKSAHSLETDYFQKLQNVPLCTESFFKFPQGRRSFPTHNNV